MLMITGLDYNIEYYLESCLHFIHYYAMRFCILSRDGPKNMASLVNVQFKKIKLTMNRILVLFNYFPLYMFFKMSMFKFAIG